jgi:alanyl-tRNA synthetase
MMVGMGLPLEDTVVTFPAGAVTATSQVHHVATVPSGLAVVTACTPFHPVDPRWPDQGPDRGTLTIEDVAYQVIDVTYGATDGESFFVGDDVPVRRGTAGWAFLVVHVLPAGSPPPALGAAATLQVDARYRAALSAGHTACHVATLALNAALADRWRKDPGVDGLGSPGFDARALTSSRIQPDSAVDAYRLGKSLRKSGFETEGLAAALPEVTAGVNRRLTEWIAAAAPVRIEVAGPRLTDLREWVCDLAGRSARIPCGGTHVDSLAAFDRIAVELDLDEPNQSLVMRTSAVRSSSARW